jgi:hypothetical protein
MCENRVIAGLAEASDQRRGTHGVNPFDLVLVGNLDLPTSENQSIRISGLVHTLAFCAVAAKSNLRHYGKSCMGLSAIAVGRNFFHPLTLLGPYCTVNFILVPLSGTLAQSSA